MTKERVVFEALIEDAASRYKETLSPQKLADIYLRGRITQPEPHLLPLTDEEKARLNAAFSAWRPNFLEEIKKCLT